MNTDRINQVSDGIDEECRKDDIPERFKKCRLHIPGYYPFASVNLDNALETPGVLEYLQFGESEGGVLYMTPRKPEDVQGTHRAIRLALRKFGRTVGSDQVKFII